MSSLLSDGPGQESPFSPEDRKELAIFLETEQSKARLQSSIHTFTDMCWDRCITGKIGTKLSSGEESCLTNCVERFLDTSILIVKQLESKRASS
ncbi:Tim10/DDP family zinc finger-domain-containing protein [Syncephalis pseudoplumigaleata]|uniref:Mitochondrial import inner membrane translocase subunit n=1 Tax=Syncephalis pseudoplumigaleata TaxID=1712513 RepID=A0A4P9Z680_9FUNG|nr:Tim10/DDP family zinc finger-domain-containing protein [Syncephalis pseudoplumigaleata]|eukprot:RKP28096.1 Tim10/DDP family zinc finger-domain-containing protein [Syncephalis pseudoplumigaleata]